MPECDDHDGDDDDDDDDDDNNGDTSRAQSSQSSVCDPHRFEHPACNAVARGVMGLEACLILD